MFFNIIFIYPLFNQKGSIEIQYLFFQGVLLKMSSTFSVGLENIRRNANTQRLTKTQNK